MGSDRLPGPLAMGTAILPSRPCFAPRNMWIRLGPRTDHGAGALRQRVRALRAAASLTQEKLAFRSEFDRSYGGQIERGEVNVSIDNIGKLARGLRVAVKALFEFSPLA